jgi:hypothetical protein
VCENHPRIGHEFTNIGVFIREFVVLFVDGNSGQRPTLRCNTKSTKISGMGFSGLECFRKPTLPEKQGCSVLQNRVFFTVSE